jgi:hypothetical protein
MSHDKELDTILEECGVLREDIVSFLQSDPQKKIFDSIAQIAYLKGYIQAHHDLHEPLPDNPPF